MVNNKIAQRAVAAGLSGLMAFGAAAPAALAFSDVPFEFVDVNDNDNGDYFKRIGGDTRYDTMKDIVESYNKIGYTYGWTLYGPDTSTVYNYHTTAVVASGDNFPDALAANGLAGYLTNMNLAGGWTDGSVPVILTKAGSLSSQAKDLLKNMQVQNVIIMGGTAAVSQDVEDAIAKLGIGVSRIAGKDRQETSLKALQRINGNWKGRKGTYDLIIATGSNYADALSIAPYAYRMGTPIILTKEDGTLTDAQVDAIKANDEIQEIIIVGGKNAVSDTVMAQIGTLKQNKIGVNYIRLGESDRYETSAKIAEFEVSAWREYWKGTDFSFDHVIVATGEKFPDALAGGQLAGGYWLPNRSIEDFSGLNAWSPCPLLLTKDGNRTAEGIISKMIAAEGVNSHTSTYASQATWDETLNGAYGNNSDTYNNLINVWYGCTTPKYVNFSGLMAARDNALDNGFTETTDSMSLAETAGFDVTLADVTVAKAVRVDKLTGKDSNLAYNVLGSDADTWKDGKNLVVTVQEQNGANIEVEVKGSDIKEKVKQGGANSQSVTVTGTVKKNDHGITGEMDVDLTLTCETAKHVTAVDEGSLTATPAGAFTSVKLVDYDKFQLTFVGGTKTITIGDGETTISGNHVTYSSSSTIGWENFNWYTDVIGLANSATPDFYGIILGGTSAISNDKRDDLDDAVAMTAGTNNVFTDGDLDIDVFSENMGVNIRYTRLVPINQSVRYSATETGLVYRVAATDDYVLWVYTTGGDTNTGRWVFVKGGSANTAYAALTKTNVASDSIYGYNKTNPYNKLSV